MRIHSNEDGGESTGAGALPCGDPTRMGRILLGLEPRLMAVARRLVRDPDAAADVVQNAFEKILRCCEQFRRDARPSTWMHRIVVNEAFMWLRREKRRAPARIEPADWELVFSRAGDPEQEALTREELARLEGAFDRLAGEDRDLLTAWARGDQSYVDLGRELGLSGGAVKSRAFRARRRLAARLEST